MTTRGDAGKDGATGLDGGGVCLFVLTCYPVSDAGICGAPIYSAACSGCPAGYVTSNDCAGFDDGGIVDASPK
jgi:hypothetical protein